VYKRRQRSYRLIHFQVIQLLTNIYSTITIHSYFLITLPPPYVTTTMQLKALVIMSVVAACQAQSTCGRPGQSVVKICNRITPDSCHVATPTCGLGQVLVGYEQGMGRCPDGSDPNCYTMTTTVCFLSSLMN